MAHLLVNLLTEAMGRTVMPGNCALMGATRLASGHFSAASMNVYVSKRTGAGNLGESVNKE